MDTDTDVFHLFSWDNTRAAIKRLEKLLECQSCGKIAENATSLGRCDHFFCQSCIEDLENGICPTCLIPSPPCDNKPDRIIMSLVESSRDLLNLLPKEDDSSTCATAPCGPETKHPCTPPQQIRTASKTQTLQSLRLFQSNEQNNLQKGNKVGSTNRSNSSGSNNKKGATSEIKTESKKGKTNTVKSKPYGRKSPVEDVNGSVSSRSGFITPDKQRSILKPLDLSILGVSPSVGAGNTSSSTAPNNNINKRNAKGETLLHVACVKGDVEKVRNLLKAGARPNTKDNAGWTPLHEVCQHGSWELTKLLLDHGAIIDAPGPSNETPLLDAVINGRDDLIRLLRSYGASDSTIDMFGRTPRTIADRCIAASEMHAALDTKRDTTLVLPPISPVMYEKMVLLGSGLSPEKNKSLEKLSKLLRVRLASEFSQDVTHIVAETQADNHKVCQRTIKYMMGLVAGKWILSHKWSEECLSVGGPVNPVPFEIQGTTHNTSSNGPASARDNTNKMNPGLFNGCHMYLYGTFREPYPSKKDMEAIIRAGGGVVLVREPNPEAISHLDQTVPFHAEVGSPLSQCSHYVIYQEGSQEPQLKYTMKHIKSLPLAWIMSCIDHYKLIVPFN